MTKETTIPTRLDLIATVEKTFKEIETTTRAKAWTFSNGKMHYVVISFVHDRINCVEVYESTKAGRKTSNTPIVNIKGSKDHLKAFNLAMDILIPVTEEEAIS